MASLRVPTTTIRNDRRSRAAVCQPRQEHFPSPTPLSEEEQLLATYAWQNQHSNTAAGVATPRLEQPLAELEIGQLEIWPIEAKP
jgi:hypothetical protein